MDNGVASGTGSHAPHEAGEPSSPPVSIPNAIAEQVLAMGRVEWGATDELDDAGHLAHLAESLRLTREYFDFDAPVRMHGLYLEGTERVLCHAGTSPNSGANAQALAGAWNWLHDQCASAMSAGTAETRHAAQGDSPPARPEGDAKNPMDSAI